MGTVILKIGGSVITQKHRDGVFVRRALLARIARELKREIDRDPSLRLIIIHGAGSAGHQLAHTYGLAEGIGTNAPKKKWHGAFLTRLATHKLNGTVADIFVQNGLRVVSVHPASVITQKNGAIETFSRDAIDHALATHCIPLLYGEIVFDTVRGMSICSGDAIGVRLAKIHDATRLLYASDVDGIFDRDPHTHTDATLIRRAHIRDILSNDRITLSRSRHTDVTGGLKNKISSLCRDGIPTSLREVVIFNGLKKGSFAQALAGKSDGTIISLR